MYWDWRSCMVRVKEFELPGLFENEELESGI